MKKNQLLSKIKTSEVTADYLATNTRTGGNFQNTYSKQLPKVLIGSPKMTPGYTVEITCEDVLDNKSITLEGFIESEYLLTEYSLMYKYARDTDFTPFNKIPYDKWYLTLSATDVYNSNSLYITVKVVGKDSTGAEVVLESRFDLIVEAECETEISCDNASSDTVFRISNYSHQETFTLIVDDVSYAISSLEHLKRVLDENNLTLEIYTFKES